MNVHGVPLLGGLLETMLISSYESVISKVCLALCIVKEGLWGDLNSWQK